MNRFIVFLMVVFLISGCDNKIHHNPGNGTKTDEDSHVEPDEDIVEAPLIFDVKVEKNEKNVLSCRLTFKTEEKMKTVVKYFSKDHAGYEMIEEKEQTEHYFFLWGMKAERKYTIEIYDEKNLKEPLEVTEYVSGIIPDSVPFSFLAVNEKEKVSEGFVLFTSSATVAYMAMPVAMMMDTDGEIVWYFEYYMAGFNIFGDVQYIEETATIMISLCKGPNMADIPAEEAIEIDLEGNVIWKSPEFANIYDDPGSWNHIYERLSDDTILMLRSNLSGTLLFQDVVNVDRDYNKLWTWDPRDHLEAPECNPAEWCDWVHFNAAEMFEDAGVVYVNSRNLSQYFKIDMYSGDIVWTLGKGGDFVIDSDDPYPWFEVAHDPEIREFNGDTVLFYDNGSLERGFSRVIEYKLDFENMTAQISFVFDGSKIDRMWFNEYWGDADSLPSGNIFVTAGDYVPESTSRLFEINKDGEIVWELFMDKQEEWMVTLYNAQKFIPPLKRLQ